MAYIKCIRNLISSTVPDGKTVTPTDDISIWLACGGRSETYTTLSQVLADVACLSALINDNNAVDYLVRSTKWASDICGDSSAMSYIGLNNYASNTLLADSTWRTAICNSAYFESVLNVKVPAMTSNTTPSGECFGTNVESGKAYYYAFDGNNSTNYSSDSNSPTLNACGYDFGSNVKIYKFTYSPRQDWNTKTKLQGSADKSNWDDMCDFINNPTTSTAQTYTELITPITAYRYIQVVGTVTNKSDRSMIYFSIQFYGRADI